MNDHTPPAVDTSAEDTDTAPVIPAWRRVGLLVVTGVVFIGLIALAGWSRFGNDGGELPGVGVKQVVDPPTALADFTLTSHTGEPLRLSDLRGKPVLLFFGFTHCPDVCPTTLAEFRAIKQQLGDRADAVAFVFVSVDGSRDTPESLAAYVGRFDPDFIGLTGDEDLVRSIGREYHLFFQRAELESSDARGDAYTVDHTTYSYLIDAEGRLRVIYPFRSSMDMVVADIVSLL